MEHESRRIPRSRGHPPRRRSRTEDRAADGRDRPPHRERHLRHRPALRARHDGRDEARHASSATRAWAWSRRSASAVRNFEPGDRVVIPSTIACGHCSYCRAGYYAQCDNANPNGAAGTAFFGGPEEAGALRRAAGRVRPRSVRRTPAWSSSRTRSPTSRRSCSRTSSPPASSAPTLAEIRPGDTVAVFGCGPVGAVRDRQREADGRRARLRHRPARGSPRHGPRARARRRSTSRPRTRSTRSAS